MPVRRSMKGRRSTSIRGSARRDALTAQRAWQLQVAARAEKRRTEAERTRARLSRTGGMRAEDKKMGATNYAPTWRRTNDADLNPIYAQS